MTTPLPLEKDSPGPTKPENVQNGHLDDLASVSFDEGIMRTLMELDSSIPLLLERLKQTTSSASQVSQFLRRRAAIEEDYARQLLKLSQSTLQGYSVSASGVRAGSFLSSFSTLVKAHDQLADNRLRFANQCTEMAEAIMDMVREVERSRKASKDMGARLEKSLSEAEQSTDKAKARFEIASEDLERLLLSKAGEAQSEGSLKSANASTRDEKRDVEPGAKKTFGKAILAGKFKTAALSKNPAAYQKLEDELRVKTAKESDGYVREVQQAQQLRQEYFNRERPRLLRALKESSDEADLGTQYHLARYANLFEAVLCQDGLIVAPLSIEDGLGLRACIDGIDNREDFKTFMQAFIVNFMQSGQKVVARTGPADETLSVARISMSLSQTSPRQTRDSFGPSAGPSKATFGIDLGEQMLRDNVEVPKVLEKCAEAIEAHGLEMTGIYRLSGTTSRIQRLKAKLDRDVDSVDLLSDENLSDINDITGALKAWFRELPEPLMTYTLYHGFIDAAKIENDRLRHIRLHERVNDLPDPCYATLKYLMGHLDKVAKHGDHNSMHASNLAIVFGPTLFRPPPGEEGAALTDMTWQCKAVETIVIGYKAIFVEEAEG